jgi:membrane protein required for colicin V production
MVTSLDIAFLVILLFFVTIGFIRGFIKEISALLVWILSSIAAWFLAESASSFFVSAVPETEIRLVISFVVVFAAFYVIISLALYFLRKALVTVTFLKVSNQILGGVVAAAKSLFIILVLVLLAGFTGLPQKTWWKQSLLAPYFVDAALWSKQFLYGDIARHIRYR